MSKEHGEAGKLKHVFIKAGERRLVPNNFGSCLLKAASEGLCTKEQLADLLGTEVGSIKKTGDNLKAREIASVSRALVQSASL